MTDHGSFALIALIISSALKGSGANNGWDSWVGELLIRRSKISGVCWGGVGGGIVGRVGRGEL